MATPHLGSESASGSTLDIVSRVVSVFTETDLALVSHLRRDSEWLEQQLAQYKSISADFHTVFLYEVYKTKIHSGRSEIVDHLQKLADV